MSERVLDIQMYDQYRVPFTLRSIIKGILDRLIDEDECFVAKEWYHQYVPGMIKVGLVRGELTEGGYTRSVEWSDVDDLLKRAVAEL